MQVQKSLERNVFTKTQFCLAVRDLPWDSLEYDLQMSLRSHLTDTLWVRIAGHYLEVIKERLLDVHDNIGDGENER